MFVSLKAGIKSRLATNTKCLSFYFVFLNPSNVILLLYRFGILAFLVYMIIYVRVAYTYTPGVIRSSLYVCTAVVNIIFEKWRVCVCV